MSTPLEVRNKRREAQRTIRLALNAMNHSLDAWKAAIQEGKQAAIDLTNSILTLDHVSTIPLYALADVPNLRRDTSSKILMRISQHMQKLASCQEALEVAVQSLHAAVAPVAALAAEEERENKLRGGAVFTTLSLPSIYMMLQQIEDMHQSELTVKQAVVADCRDVCHVAQQKLKNKNMCRSDTHEEPHMAQWRLHSVTLESNQEIEAFLQTHITAWMVGVEVSEGQVTSDMALITQDANSC